MEESQIYHLSYVSTSCDNLKYDDIKNILEQSNKNNALSHITGILVYCNKHFFQILEGDKQEITDLFEKISIDHRHDGVIKIHEGFIEKRRFETWHMAFKSYNRELKQLDNLNTEQFYCYINTKLKEKPDVSLQILLDFFDLNG